MPGKHAQHRRLTTITGLVATAWALFHLGLGYDLGLVATWFGRPRDAFMSAGFLIDGVLIFAFSVAVLASWPGARLVGVMAYGLSALLGVGLFRLGTSPTWWLPLVTVGSACALYLCFQSIQASQHSRG